MNEEEKYLLYLKEVEKLKKKKLGTSDVIKLLNISRGTFQNIIKANDLHLIPIFTSKEYLRKNGDIYNIYKFDIYDVAKFLAER